MTPMLLVAALMSVGFTSWGLFEIGTLGACAHESKNLEDGSEFSVEVTHYQPREGVRGSVLIMPPTGGSTVLDRSYATLFCRAGFEAWIVERWTGMNEESTDLQIHERLYRRGQRAISRVLREIPDERSVGILGTSVGALHTAVAMGSQERLKAAFAITGGLPISEVIATSDQQAMQKLRRIRAEDYGLKDPAEHARAIRKVFSMEPESLPRHFEGKHLGLVVAAEESTVPGETQLHLERFWEPQVVYRSSGNHFNAIVGTWLWHRHDLVKFFETGLP